jgi:AGZA family xanthine/uracil permease-like MFS transporter
MLMITGGWTTFFTIAYVLVSNPYVLHNTGIPTNGVFFSSVLASGVFTIVMGVVTNLPIVIGPSLGLNVYFGELARTCEQNPKGLLDGYPCDTWGVTTLPWSDALGAVYLSGWLYLGFTVTGFRGYLYDAIPRSFRAAISVGTGFFLFYQGLVIGQITRVSVASRYIPLLLDEAACDTNADGVCNTVNLGQRWYNIGVVNFSEVPAARIAVVGICIAAVLELYSFRASLIIAIWGATLIGISYYECRSTRAYDDDYFTPCVTDLSLWSGQPSKIPFLVNWTHNPAGKLTFKYANTTLFWNAVFTFLYFELFDSYGAIEAIVTKLGLTNNHPTVAVDRINRAMFVDGVSVWLGSIIGANSLNVYIESNTGVQKGARTGLASIVTGCSLMLCLLFLNPFVSIIPPAATTGALCIVGVYSMLEYKNIDFKDYILRISCFLTIATMGFTFSITIGISVGIIFYCWLQILAVTAKKTIGWDMAEIRPGTKVEWPHFFLILLAIFAACRFSFLGQS